MVVSCDEVGRTVPRGALRNAPASIHCITEENHERKAGGRESEKIRGAIARSAPGVVGGGGNLPDRQRAHEGGGPLVRKFADGLPESGNSSRAS